MSEGVFSNEDVELINKYKGGWSRVGSGSIVRVAAGYEQDITHVVQATVGPKWRLNSGGYGMLTDDLREALEHADAFYLGHMCGWTVTQGLSPRPVWTRTRDGVIKGIRYDNKRAKRVRGELWPWVVKHDVQAGGTSWHRTAVNAFRAADGDKQLVYPRKPVDNTVTVTEPRKITSPGPLRRQLDCKRLFDVLAAISLVDQPVAVQREGLETLHVLKTPENVTRSRFNKAQSFLCGLDLSKDKAASKLRQQYVESARLGETRADKERRS